MACARIRVVVLVTGIALLPHTVVATCVGDCDGEDGVLINEVVSTVNVFLGNSTPGTCPNADRNADGEVTIDEVVAAVSSFLVGPSACPLVAPATPPPTRTAPPQASDTATPTQTVDVPPSPTASPTASFTAIIPSATMTLTPLPTATATATRTATLAATPTPRPAVCNNGVLEQGETCTKCPMDCKVKSCTPTSTVVTLNATFNPPPGEDASSVTAVVGYRSDRVSIPGKGTGSCTGGSKDGKACNTGSDCPGGQCTLPKSRIKNTPPGSIVGVNDLDYGVRVVLTRSGQIAAGRIFSVEFDTCQGAAAVTVADFGCTVDGCARSSGNVDGCTCTVVTP